MVETDEDQARSDRAHEILTNCAAGLRALGLTGVAAWRAMSWAAADRLIEESAPADAITDLKRLCQIVDDRLQKLEADAA
ncbi:MAG: hypothetical protein VYD64_02705 [Pseudomonadota bacterium]|nr:hypothetical protein [Pseudomonadota bacterium]